VKFETLDVIKNTMAFADGEIGGMFSLANAISTRGTH
jgi:hypothetical protein